MKHLGCLQAHLLCCITTFQLLKIFQSEYQSIQDMEGDKHTGCCPPGSWPALQTTYEPKGEVLQVGGVPVYHIGQGSRVLIIITDIFGAFTGRNQSIADTFANWGYNVYLPQILSEVFTGDLSIRDKIMTYIKELDQAKMKQTFAALVAHLESQGHKKYLVIGFCWGVWKAFRLATEFEGFIAIAGFHPSIGCENLMGGVQTELTKRVKCPAFLYPAGNDPQNIKHGGELVQILEEKFGADKTGTIEFPEMIHGWVVRGDLADEKVKRDTEAALHHAHGYFSKFEY